MRARDYQPGDRVPGTVYVVARLIGAGGMGTVYDVEDTTIGKRYVLKTLHPQLGAREDLTRRIQNEARTLARLNHPNIVEVITAGVTADALRLPFYVMERLSGQSLRLVLEKKGRLELPHAYHIGIDLLDALDHAHDKGVIHRDVKPDNIFLHRTPAGVTLTKLLDFGIVSVLDGGTRDTAGRFLGTLRYAAPEQLRGEPPTAKMDVYAAGLVIYEVIAGRGPFDDEGDSQRIAAAHVNKYPPPVSRFAAVPKELDTLLMAALAKNPEGRPRDAFSFAASLRNLKRLAQVQPQESTENRVTAPAVIEPDSGVLVYVDEPSSDGQFVISPVSSAPATGFPRTTVPGMAPPTAGATATSFATQAPGATTAQAIYPMGQTGTLAADTARAPRHGTEALSVAPWEQEADAAPATTIPWAEPPPAAAFGPIEWPPERDVMHSEEPQVRSLPIFSGPRNAARPVVAMVVTVTVLAAAAIFLVGRAMPATGVRAVGAPATGVPLAVPPPSAASVVTAAAPTIALPPLLATFDDSNAKVGRASARAAPSASSGHAKTAASASSARPDASLHFAVDRPGPGF